MSITYRGETFAGYNKPKRTPNHPTKSHAVLAKEGNTIKLIRFGEQGAKTAGKPKKGESAKMKAKRTNMLDIFFIMKNKYKLKKFNFWLKKDFY